MPYRPLRAIGIAAAAMLVYDAVLVSGVLWRPLDAATRMRILEMTAPFEIAAVVVVAVLSSAVYRSRARSIEAELARDDLAAQASAQAATLAQTNRELVEAQNELVRQRHLAALGNLVAGVAHELNNPTGALGGAADVLERGVRVLEEELNDPSPKTARALAAVRSAHGSTREASARIERVVRSLRLFARLDEAEEQLLDVHGCLESAVERLAPRLEGAALERHYAELPKIRCRPALLNEVFFELVGNAADAAGPGGEIQLRSALEGDHLVVSVLDDGPGIPPDQREKVFEPGFTTKGRGVGVGLGLSTVSRIVAEHGGRLEVQDAPTGGAEFRVVLPRPRALARTRSDEPRPDASPGVDVAPEPGYGIG
jgi:two-component system NtrC family sensor kinase